MQSIRGVLRDVFGFDQFRGAQESIVEHIVAGGDALVLMPTGAGKSLCYMIPALRLHGMIYLYNIFVVSFTRRVNML